MKLQLNTIMSYRVFKLRFRVIIHSMVRKRKTECVTCIYNFPNFIIRFTKPHKLRDEGINTLSFKQWQQVSQSSNSPDVLYKFPSSENIANITGILKYRKQRTPFCGNGIA